MHPLIRCGLLVLLLALTSPVLRAAPDGAAQKEAARMFLEAVAADLAKDKVTAPYFAKAAPVKIDDRLREGLGWMESWSHMNDAALVLKPQFQQPVPELKSERGIYFHLFVARGHGDDLISRQINYAISPELHAGLDLETKDPALQDRVDAIIRSHLFALKTAVESPMARVTFERDDGVWVGTLDGKPPKKISGGQCPALSPDGTRLVFNTVQDDGQPAHRQIAIADLETGKITISDKIPSTNCTNPCWSPDGRQILFTIYVDNDSHVGLVHADGTGFRYITDNKDAKRSYWAVTWNAKGTGFFAEDMENLYLLDLDARVLKKWPITKLVPGGDMSGSTRLEASPDGKSLLMDVGLDEKAREGWDGPFPSIWVLDLKTEKATRITPPGFYAWDGQWLEPSASILFTSQGAKDKDSSIYLMSVGDQGEDKKLLFKNARYPGAP